MNTASETLSYYRGREADEQGKALDATNSVEATETHDDLAYAYGVTVRILEQAVEE